MVHRQASSQTSSQAKARRAASAILGLLGILAVIGGVLAWRQAKTPSLGVTSKAAPRALWVGERAMVVGTSGGLYVTSDGKTWHRPPGTGERAVTTLEASPSNEVIALGPGYMARSKDGLRWKSTSISKELNITALAWSAQEQMWLWDSRKGLLRSQDMLVHTSKAPVVEGNAKDRDKGPDEVLDLEWDGEVLLAAGPQGVWQTSDEGRTWRNLLTVSSTSLETRPLPIEIQAPKTRPYFLGTQGGMLTSTDIDSEWQFTSFRRPVAALVFRGQTIFMLTHDRAIVAGPDGSEDWRVVGRL